MPSVVTIREAVRRAKEEGFPISEYSLRMWVKNGGIPTRKVGKKVLLYYPNLVKFLQCENGCDNLPAPSVAEGVRRVEV